MVRGLGATGNRISVAATAARALLGLLLFWPGGGAAASPTSVSIPASFQSELGCPGDWDPACAVTQLSYDASDDVWQGTFLIPAGSWEYKAALDGSWTVNYGLNATQNGPNIPLGLGAVSTVKFYYDDKTHWVTDNNNSVIATVPGDFQSEMGCPGDWQPDCLRSWLQDPSGSGTYSFMTALPSGSYECKVAINENWSENYGAGGVPNGPNIPFTIPAAGGSVRFSYDPASHVLTVTLESTPTPTMTPTGTPTVTPTATPTLIPLGESCSTGAQCASTFCAPSGVCCNAPCVEPNQSCTLPSSVGLCRAQGGAAPAASHSGLIALGIVLVALGVLSLRRAFTARP